MQTYRITWTLKGVKRIEAENEADAYRKFIAVTARELADDGELEIADPVKEETE